MTFQSVTFGTDQRSAVSNDHDHLNRGIDRSVALSDAAKSQVGIQTKVGTLTTYNTGSGMAATQGGVQSVQLRAPTGLVKVAGFQVTPEVAQTLTEAAPEMFLEPEAKAAQEAEAALEADKARSEDISREELNRHPGEIEGYHQLLLGECSTQNLISLMVYGQRNEAPPTDLLNRLASEMGETLDGAIEKINSVSAGTSAQFTILARSMNLDPVRAQAWIAEHRRDTALAVAQAHFLRRDLQAWTPLLKDYQSATGDGRKH